MSLAKRWTLAAGSWLFISTVVQAQADRYAPTVLQIAPTPRAATFASNTAARDIEAIFSNPAMVGVAAGTVVAVGRFDAATHLTVASTTSLGPFSVGARRVRFPTGVMHSRWEATCPRPARSAHSHCPRIFAATASVPP
jgi:hypothetical protein